MAGAPSAWTHFVAELKRRLVFRVAAVCLAASCAPVQAAPRLFRALLRPDRALRPLVVLPIPGSLAAAVIR